MKKIFTLLTSLTLSVSLFAADVDLSSSLTVKSNNSNAIKVVMDGKSFESPYSSVKISNIDAGVHNVTVYQKRSTDLSYCDDQYEAVYNASLAIEPASQMSITIGHSGKARLNDKTSTAQNFIYSDNVEIADQYGHNSTIATTDFSYVLQSIQKEWVESNRMKSASQIISSNFFTTEQVKQLLKLFSSDDNQLELAKKAYDKTIDQDNYKCIGDVLSLKAKIELEKYIDSCR